jgi:hypothetical protein
VAEYLRTLNQVFKDIQESSINPGMLKAYRETPSPMPSELPQSFTVLAKMASHSRITYELNVLVQTLRACKDWQQAFQ